MLTLTLKAATNLPLDLTGIVPDVLASKSQRAITQMAIRHGNRETPLGELFTVRGNASDGAVTLEGDLHTAVNLGAEMKSGSLAIVGAAGDDVGRGMWGGMIEISDNAGNNLGAEMHGGLIRVRGSAQANVGGALAGSSRGMAGGTILIDGDAGDFVGRRMRRGLIAVRGRTGHFLGHNMLAGSIVALGSCGKNPGADMTRGTICLAEPTQQPTLPTFRFACTAHAPVLGMVGRHLQSLGFENDIWHAGRQWHHFNGDFLNSGRGEILSAE